MRKDVKLGFAIGGILLAVIVVYVLAVSGGGKTKKTSDVALETTPAPGEVTRNTSNGESAGEEKASTPAPDSAANESNPSAESNVATAAQEPKTDPFKSAADDKWAAALNTGKVPLMMTQTPTSDARSASSSEGASTSAKHVQSGFVPVESDSAPADATAPNVDTTPASATNRPVGSSSGYESTPATLPSSALAGATGGTATKYTVQPGDSFATIALKTYGSSAFYPHLLRANPTVDARKLKVGMVINLPPASEVRADQSSAASSAGGETTPSAAETISAKVDSKTDYRVVAGDTLYKISKKLYGKADRADKIYELNKSTIGDNPAKLKVGSVLKLPEAPTAAPAR